MQYLLLIFVGFPAVVLGCAQTQPSSPPVTTPVSSCTEVPIFTNVNANTNMVPLAGSATQDGDTLTLACQDIPPAGSTTPPMDYRIEILPGIVVNSPALLTCIDGTWFTTDANQAAVQSFDCTTDPVT